MICIFLSTFQFIKVDFSFSRLYYLYIFVSNTTTNIQTLFRLSGYYQNKVHIIIANDNYMTDLKRVKKVINWHIFQDFAENEKGVADIIGYTKSSFSQIINGKVPLSERFIDKLASIDENINKVWIKTGVGEMLKENTNYMQITYKLETDNNVINQAIPIYEIDATAGHITLFDNQITQNPVGKISIPNAPKCDGALYVRGDSMYPILKAGDIVAYKIINDPNNIFWGEMYLIDIDVEGEQHRTMQ